MSCIAGQPGGICTDCQRLRRERADQLKRGCWWAMEETEAAYRERLAADLPVDLIDAVTRHLETR